MDEETEDAGLLEAQATESHATSTGRAWTSVADAILRRAQGARRALAVGAETQTVCSYPDSGTSPESVKATPARPETTRPIRGEAGAAAHGVRGRRAPLGGTQAHSS